MPCLKLFPLTVIKDTFKIVRIILNEITQYVLFKMNYVYNSLFITLTHQARKRAYLYGVPCHLF